MKRLLILMGVFGALAIGILAVAVAGAQEGSPTNTPDATDDPDRPRPLDNFLDKLAENLGISRDDLDSAIDETQTGLIDEAVSDGRLDEDRADDLKERIANGEPLFPRFFGHGPRFHGSFGRPLAGLIGNAAELLGMETRELFAGLADGKSISDIAEEKSIGIDDLKSDLLTAAKDDLQAKVDEGSLTQERADKAYEKLEENIDRLLEAKHGFDLNIDGEGLRERFRMHIGEGRPFRQAPFGLPDIESGSFPLPPFGLPDIGSGFFPPEIQVESGAAFEGA